MDRGVPSLVAKIDRVVGGLNALRYKVCVLGDIDCAAEVAVMVTELADIAKPPRASTRRRMSDAVKQDIIGAYISGASSRAVARRVGFDKYSVLRVLHDAGVYVRSGSEQTRINNGTLTVEDD